MFPHSLSRKDQESVKQEEGAARVDEEIRQSGILELVQHPELHGNRHNLDNGQAASRTEEENVLTGNVVDWDGPDDPKNPLNW